MPASSRGLFGLPARRPIFGLDSAPAPPVVFVALGVLLGPNVVGVLDAGLMARSQIVVSVALAMLGVYVGLGMRRRDLHRTGGLLAAATLESGVTILLTGAGLWMLASQWRIPLPLEFQLFATVAAFAAAASAAPGTTDRLAGIADLDDVVVVVGGGIVLAAIAGGGVTPRLAIASGASAVVGVAGHWLFEKATTAERVVFVSGAILLLAGIGSYLLVSPLLTGFIAAVVWVALPGAADRVTAGDLQRLQHVLVAALLAAAGASISWDVLTLWVGGALVLLRLLGKLLASMLMARLVRAPAVALAHVLVPPGLIGIAFALNAAQLLDTGGGTLVGSIVVCVVVTDAAAAFLPWQPVGAES